MPRHKKCRKVCSLPHITAFAPVGKDADDIILTVEEYECIRLIDKHRFSQEECAAYMQVARTTVQQIYNLARVKIATALVDGMGIRIYGGDYRLCDGKEEHCNCGGCQKHCKRDCEIHESKKFKKIEIDITKGKQR